MKISAYPWVPKLRINHILRPQAYHRITRLAVARRYTMTDSKDIPDASPDINPVDHLRVEIAHELNRISGIPPKDIFAGLAYTASFEHGDLNLAIPRFRIKDPPPPALAQKWVSEVTSFPH
jgi:hypothetical protein